ncbi:MAG: phosphoribosylanthranilate isomerase [Rhizobiaceae bacterium]
MDPLIKICGLSTPETVLAALENRAHLVGFIFFPKSPRNVSVAKAATLRELARGRAMVVAVTVDADDAMLDEIVNGMRPDVLQLHGHETPERVSEVKTRYGLPVIKAISVSEASDLAAVKMYAGIANKILLDAKAPKGSLLPGGNGVSFDWTLLSALDPDLDYMLSGGLNAANVGEALRMTKAPGLDVSSGVESAPGIKDIGLMDEFFTAIKVAGQGVN